MKRMVHDIVPVLVDPFLPASASKSQCRAVSEKVFLTLDRLPYIYRSLVFSYLVCLNYLCRLRFLGSPKNTSSVQRQEFQELLCRFPGWASVSKLLRTLTLLNCDYSTQ